MSLRSFVLPLMAAASLGIAACGGDESDDGGDFTADADAVCVDQARQSADLALAREAPPADQETVVAAFEELTPVLEGTQSELEALEPPADVSADYDEYLSLRQQRIDALDAAVSADADGDAKGFEAAAAKNSSLVDEYEVVGEKAGLEACANVLPEDDVAAVEAAEQEVSASDDAADFCEGFLLPQGLQQLYGTDDPKKCLDDPKAADPIEVEVHEVSGVDGIVAFAVVEFPEEKGAGRGPFEDTLYNVDGEWKLYSTATTE